MARRLSTTRLSLFLVVCVLLLVSFTSILYFTVDVFFMTGTVEVCGTVELEAGKPAEIVLQFTSPVAAQALGFTQIGAGSLSIESRGGVRWGGGRAFEEDQGIKEAVEIAKRVDKVVLVVGLNNGMLSANPRFKVLMPHSNRLGI
jgi:hypothetical protein